MSILLGVCAVIVTISIAAAAIAIVRATRRFERTAEDLTRTTEAVRGTVNDAQAILRKVDHLAGSMTSVVQPLQRAAVRVGAVGDRAAHLSHQLLNEVERPLRITVALLTGVRTGTRSLMDAIARRRSRLQPNGGQPHE